MNNIIRNLEVLLEIFTKRRAPDLSTILPASEMNGVGFHDPLFQMLKNTPVV
jgi:hypothetical protein